MFLPNLNTTQQLLTSVLFVAHRHTSRAVYIVVILALKQEYKFGRIFVFIMSLSNLNNIHPRINTYEGPQFSWKAGWKDITWKT
jgi:hypothetical protein